MTDKQETATDEAVDPLEFVRALLHISPEDAAEVRRDAAAKGTRSNQARRSEFVLTDDEAKRLAELTRRFHAGEKLPLADLIEMESLNAENGEAASLEPSDTPSADPEQPTNPA